jgi:cell wall-associated NlpC family hydrolase
MLPNVSTTEYCVRANLNLYDSPECQRLATQAARGRHLRIVATETGSEAGAIAVCLCEDDYPGWIVASDRDALESTAMPYQAVVLSPEAIQARLPEVIAFMQAAMAQPNCYLWGGTIAPDYDCSGLMQAAFAANGIWLPRDAYQQEAFLHPIPESELRSGDFVFFGTPEKATHVGLYLGNGTYIHSSGKEQGRNGIGIDSLVDRSDPVSQSYYQQLRGYGRVVASYQPR